MCFIALFFHKLFRKEATEQAGLKLTDLLEKYMFPQSKVMLGTRIGKSVFGTVYKGYAHKILPHETETLVAIKVISGSSSDAASLYETQKVDNYIRPKHGTFTMIFLHIFRCYYH